MARESLFLDEAREILESVRNKPQTPAERKRLAVELAACMLRQASNTMTSSERSTQEQLSRLMNDPLGKAFTTMLTDSCFRSSHNRRSADQMIYLLHQLGTPQYLDWFKRLELQIFRVLNPSVAQFLVPFAHHALRKETARVIVPGEPGPLKAFIEQRKEQGALLNLNHLGEAILSEEEAVRRLHVYLADLENPLIDYVSIKISTIFSQINLLDFQGTIEIISERLRELYRAAIKNPVIDSSGAAQNRFINLDMEEYRDLHLTTAVFRNVLEEPEFHHYSAGIVLQAYLPDSHDFQKELTEWARSRVQNGGAPIKIRIVKGANLAMEQVEASLKEWPQAPYYSKLEVDANYKRMVLYGCIPENARAVHLGIASHNLFDIAFAMLLRLENGVEPYIQFEMLEGMADHIRRVVQELTGSILLYTGVATKKDFPHAISYLIRRLDENTGADNFLRFAFGLKPGTDAWDSQIALFLQSCDEIETTSTKPRRTQSRLLHPTPPDPYASFENEADTDFSLSANREWAQNILNKWKDISPAPIPLVIGGKEVFANEEGVGFNPSAPEKPLYFYAKAHKEHLEEALRSAKEAEAGWAATSVEHRCHLLATAGQKLRERRSDLIGSMMVDGGKILTEADPEVSEAIDFAEYYRRQMARLFQIKDLSWKPKGTVLITPPWNFPCAIPAGGPLAALVAGNCVLLKPASDTVLVAWHLVQAFWDAGIPKDVLQFIPCSGEEIGRELITDSRINSVILTGGTETARKFLEMRPDLDLAAETGGKNAFIITALADRDLAIRDLIFSAFSHNGQKCSAASIAILEAEVYDDLDFRRQLRDAVASLEVGSALNLSSKISPLIHEPRNPLKQGLTTLEEGEEWLIEPVQDSENPNLWSPGIKLHVQPGSFTHQTELFGPVLALMRAENLEHALELANGTPYGLTSGLHSLDEREQTYWIEHIEAGNCYINRGITGAIVRRQPFGGTKASSFGNGAKAGGPNYLCEFLKPIPVGLPQEKHPVNEQVNNLTSFLEYIDLSAEELGTWYASIANYAYWWKRMRQDRDPSKIVGQDNLFRYVPRKNLCLRISSKSLPIEVLRVCAAVLTLKVPLYISLCPNASANHSFKYPELSSLLSVQEEKEEIFLERVRRKAVSRVRLVEPADISLQKAAAEAGVYIADAPVLANGRIELLNYLREVSISCDYHRYGNLGLREGEFRKPIL